MRGFWRGRDVGDHRLEHVEGVIDWLVAIGLCSFVILLIFGLGAVELANFGSFVLWAMIAALASLLVGAGLGLLFGLPTVRRVEITRAPSVDLLTTTPDNVGKPVQLGLDDVPLGYAESTNLEHVADWLTKIIIGLTLTQFGLWEQRFARLSYDLGYRLLGGPECGPACNSGVYPAGTTVPGGALMIFYAVLGFLVAYLWMRGYFITDMETAKRAAKEAAARKLRDDRREETAEAELAKAKADYIAADQARLKAEAEKASAEADRALAVEARLKAEAEAQAERDKARAQGLLQERDVSFTADAASIAETIEFRAAPDARDAAQEIKESVAANHYPDDPWRGKFGEAAERDGIRLTASVTASDIDSQYFDVALRIEAIDETVRAALVGKSAMVFLHPTFGSQPRTVLFGADGIAPLQLLAYGAFTVGILVETGTKLELNLATIPGLDSGFLSR